MNKLAIGLAMTAVVFSMGAWSQEDDNGGADPQAKLGKLLGSEGQVLCTAAVNSNGTKAGGFFLKSVSHVGTGTYQVVFNGACGANVKASTGHLRHVQVDTLTTGTIFGGVRCTTADRAGVAAGVFVDCTNAVGTPTDTSFFLFVAR